mgnify:CR=1 FL=1
MKISVALCTYNGEKYITKQLNSIISQNVKPDEIVLCDDNSTDKTVSIAKKILSKSGIKHYIYVNEHNEGCKSNFIKCYSRCSGDIIFSCDQDDVWIDDKIQVISSKFYEDDKLVLCFSNAELIDKDDISLNKTLLQAIGVVSGTVVNEKFYKRRLYGDTFGNFLVYGCCCAFKKDFFLKLLPFPEKWYFDSWIAICAPLYGNICYVDKNLIKYRQHKNNHSGSIVSQKQRSEFKITYDQRFKNPQLYYDFYKIFLRDKYNIMTKNDQKIILHSIDFYGSLAKCKNKKKYKMIINIIKQYIIGNYSVYRGNIKCMISDIVFIIDTQRGNRIINNKSIK